MARGPTMSLVRRDGPLLQPVPGMVSLLNVRVKTTPSTLCRLRMAQPSSQSGLGPTDVGSSSSNQSGIATWSLTTSGMSGTYQIEVICGSARASTSVQVG